MTVLMATVGFTPAKVHPVIDRLDEKEELVLFYDDDKDGRSRGAAEKVAAYAESLDMPVRFVPLDAFDLVACCRVVRQEIKKRAGKDVVVSISGGTRVLLSAALLASILEGKHVVHISEKSNAIQHLPLLHLRASDVLNDKQRRVLRHIREHPGCLQRDIVDALGITKGTVSHHVKGLKKGGLVEAKGDPEDTRSQRLTAVPTAELLLME